MTVTVMFVSPSLNLLNKIVLFATCLVLTWSQGPKDSARLEAFYIDVFHKALGDVSTGMGWNIVDSR